MNCTRLLQLLAPIMPVDMAVRICLSGSPPLRSFLGNYDDRCSPSSAAALLRRCEPLRPCLSSHVTMETKTSPSAAPEIDGGDDDGSGRTRRRRKKKKVVFADSQGLALTAVHVFDQSEDDALSELQFHLTEIEGATAALQLGGNKDLTDCGAALVLDFPQPAADYLDLRNRLKAQQVCLETCSLRDRLLSGTVQVRNVCFRKSVSVRITFDRWRSFHDAPCRYLNNVYGCTDTDTFSFSVSLPEEEERLESSVSGVEFCVQFQTEDRVFWDNNGGNNYRLVAADGSENNTEIQGDHGGGGGGGGEPSQAEFGPFGSPRTSAGIFPEWQSWSRVETAAPYW